MNKTEARAILKRELETFRNYSYCSLTESINKDSYFQTILHEGTTYQVKIFPVWDDKPGGVVRVIGGIDVGGWSWVCPLGEHFLMARDGSFVDE